MYLAVTLQVAEPIRDELRERQAIADEVGEAELHVGEFAFHMRRSRARDIIPFRNSDVRGALVEREHPSKPDGVNDTSNVSGHPILELEYFATYLATHSLSESLATALRIASTFGLVEDIRTRRVDLAADFRRVRT